MKSPECGTLPPAQFAALSNEPVPSLFVHSAVVYGGGRVLRRLGRRERAVVEAEVVERHRVVRLRRDGPERGEVDPAAHEHAVLHSAHVGTQQLRRVGRDGADEDAIAVDVKRTGAVVYFRRGRVGDDYRVEAHRQVVGSHDCERVLHALRLAGIGRHHLEVEVRLRGGREKRDFLLVSLVEASEADERAGLRGVHAERHGGGPRAVQDGRILELSPDVAGMVRRPGAVRSFDRRGVGIGAIGLVACQARPLARRKHPRAV